MGGVLHIQGQGLILTKHVFWAWPTYQFTEACVTPIREMLSVCPQTETPGAKATCLRSQSRREAEPQRGRATSRKLGLLRRDSPCQGCQAHPSLEPRGARPSSLSLGQAQSWCPFNKYLWSTCVLGTKPW